MAGLADASSLFSRFSLFSLFRRRRRPRLALVLLVLHLITAGAHPEGNLDPSDFPALGVQQQQQQQQPQQAVTSTSTSTTTSITTPTLLSSYASQAGAGAHPSVTNPLTSATTPLQLEPPAANSPSRDDFPALSPFPFPTINMNGQPQQQQQQHHMNPISLLPGGVAPGSRIPPATATGQEQASAMAALQQQQQHRANLLGSMNGLPQQQQQQQQQRQPSGLQQQGQDAAKVGFVSIRLGRGRRCRRVREG